jgi:hypothetical protein
MRALTLPSPARERVLGSLLPAVEGLGMRARVTTTPSNLFS